MASPVATVRSVEELLQNVRELQHTGWRWLFRGQTDATWDLKPSVHRHYGTKEERYLTHEFRARAGVRHSRLPGYDDWADWRALMQHYGLPTRLLDWSHSPLVAAFFAAERTMRHSNLRDNHPPDAAIWTVCPGRLNQAQGLDPYIYSLNSGDLEGLVQGTFFNPDPPSKIAVAAAMSVEKDARHQVQRGAFTIHGTDVALNEMPNSRDWLRHFVVPASCVRELGNEVDALGVGLADLFPDLGSLAKDLCRRIERVR